MPLLFSNELKWQILSDCQRIKQKTAPRRRGPCKASLDQSCVGRCEGKGHPACSIQVGSSPKQRPVQPCQREPEPPFWTLSLSALFLVWVPHAWWAPGQEQKVGWGLKWTAQLSAVLETYTAARLESCRRLSGYCCCWPGSVIIHCLHDQAGPTWLAAWP